MLRALHRGSLTVNCSVNGYKPVQTAPALNTLKPGAGPWRGQGWGEPGPGPQELPPSSPEPLSTATQVGGLHVVGATQDLEAYILTCQDPQGPSRHPLTPPHFLTHTLYK